MRVLALVIGLVCLAASAAAEPVTFSATGQFHFGPVGGLSKLGIAPDDIFSVAFTIDYDDAQATYSDVPVSFVGSNWSLDTEMQFRMRPDGVGSTANIERYDVVAPNSGWTVEPMFTNLYTTSGGFTDPTAQWRVHFYFINNGLGCICSGDASTSASLTNVSMTDHAAFTERQQIPEPSTWLLLAGGVLLALPHLTRRR